MEPLSGQYKWNPETGQFSVVGSEATERPNLERQGNLLGWGEDTAKLAKWREWAARGRRGADVPEAWYRMPVYYKGNYRSLLGHDQLLTWPRYSQRMDYELELACVIGKEGIDINEDGAEAYIGGYTVMNDWSARDIQMEEMSVGLGPAKGKDFATSLGPWVVTPDEFNPADARMTARINGELWSDGNIESIHWSFPQMIAHASMDETLYPGDVLGSGTVGGGCGLELNRWLEPGDVVELEVEGIGTLRTQVTRRE